MDLQEKFKLISVLLKYPDKELKEVVEELKDLEIEGEIKEFLNYFSKASLYELQQEYVKSFDMNEKGSLYLTYHKFKDDPKRGNYLAKLVDYYRQKGFEFIDNELPDFLPVVLDFCSYMDENISLEILKSFEKELKQIQKGLEDVNSKYLPLIKFLNDLVEEKKEVKQNG